MDIIEEKNQKMAEIGQAMRYVYDGIVREVIYGVKYWGNNRNSGGISSVFEMRKDHERRGWFNDAHGAYNYSDGRVGVEDEFGQRTGIYISPNKNDADIFLAGFLSALNHSLEIKEQSKEVLWATVLVCKLDRTLIAGLERCFLKPDDTYAGESGRLTVKCAGSFVLQASIGLNLGSLILATHDYQQANEFYMAFLNASNLIDCISNPELLNDKTRFELVEKPE